MMEKNLALYLRLSQEDGDLKEESNSITNQRRLLIHYLTKIPELQNFNILEYVDDGWSGKSFQRPAVKALLSDVQKGKISCILVKDLSRFGRDYITVGEYIEKIFPSAKVRFIAINNHFDSSSMIQNTPGIQISFENLMYDYFSEESSNKVKMELFQKRKQGKFLAVLSPFGYQKSDQDHGQLIVDREAADIVRFIFECFAECGVKAEVARCLNRKNIPTPQQYAQKKGILYQWSNTGKKKMWTGEMVSRILNNRVYKGDFVFHKKEVLEVGSKKMRTVPKEEQEIVKNIHQAIVTDELFEMVTLKQKEVNRNSIFQKEKGRKKAASPSLLRGKIRCGGCGHQMTRRNRLSPVYDCRNCYQREETSVCSKNVKEEELEGVILKVVKQYRTLILQHDSLSSLEELEGEKRKKIHRRENELVIQIKKIKNEHFLDYKAYQKGDLKKEYFFTKKIECSEKIKKIEFEIEELQKTKFFSKEETHLFLKFIKYIEVYPENRIDVRFE